MVLCFVLLLFVIIVYKKNKQANPFPINKIPTHNSINYGKKIDPRNVDSTIFERHNPPTIGSLEPPSYMHDRMNQKSTYTPATMCRTQTNENVFANPNINTIGDVTIPPCELNSQAYDDNFNKFTHTEGDDIFNTNSRRQFHTVIENDQSKFMNFLYAK